MSGINMIRDMLQVILHMYINTSNRSEKNISLHQHRRVYHFSFHLVIITAAKHVSTGFSPGESVILVDRQLFKTDTFTVWNESLSYMYRIKLFNTGKLHAIRTSPWTNANPTHEDDDNIPNRKRSKSVGQFQQNPYLPTANTSCHYTMASVGMGGGLGQLLVERVQHFTLLYCASRAETPKTKRRH